MSVLTLAGLHVERQGRVLVRDASLHVAPGERLAVLGPNGAGKSTLVRAALGLIPSRGGLTLAGLDPRTAPRKEVAVRSAYLGQDSTLQPLEGLTALEVVLLGRSPHLGVWGLPSEGDLQTARDALQAVGLLTLEGREATSLSGGERRLVLLARALAQRPLLLVLDEPTAFLDLKHHHVALEAVRISLGTTGAAVAVLHDVAQARAWATHALLMKDGAVVGRGAAREVLTTAALSALFEVPAAAVDSPVWAASP